ncbi:MAG: chloride channel protein [Chitinophagaceae bacterium]|nr:chloride channel protein [Chitinophagaceae bacterium]
MYSHVITSGITVGTGGSAGLESPIVATSAAIGSNFAQTYHLNYRDRTLMLACGVAGGIAAAFNAPITGVLFVLEVLLLDVSIGSFIPLIIAAASGALLSKIILKEGILLSFGLQSPFNYNNVPFYILLGILAGFVSLYYAKIFVRLEHRMLKIKSIYKRAITGGLLLSLLILIFPTLFGEGYESIKSLANMQPEKIFSNSILHTVFENKVAILLGVTIIMLLKVVATALTLGSGGNGGNFAPSLFVGAYLGFSYSSVLQLLGFTKVPSSNYTIVAMAGILSGVFYAPLTAIFLIAEITGGYELMIPLMIVSAISYAIVKSFQPLSMEMKRLAHSNKINTHDMDKFLLSKLELTELIENDYAIIKPEYSLQKLITIIKNSGKHTFPVVDNDDQLVGVIELNQIKDIILIQKNIMKYL